MYYRNENDRLERVVAFSDPEAPADTAAFVVFPRCPDCGRFVRTTEASVKVDMSGRPYLSGFICGQHGEVGPRLVAEYMDWVPILHALRRARRCSGRDVGELVVAWRKRSE